VSSADLQIRLFQQNRPEADTDTAFWTIRFSCGEILPPSYHGQLDRMEVDMGRLGWGWRYRVGRDWKFIRMDQHPIRRTWPQCRTARSCNQGCASCRDGAALNE